MLKNRIDETLSLKKKTWAIDLSHYCSLHVCVLRIHTSKRVNTYFDYMKALFRNNYIF